MTSPRREILELGLDPVALAHAAGRHDEHPHLAHCPDCRGDQLLAVVDAVGGHRYAYGDEADLQWALGCVFARAGLPAEREVRLNSRDRADFMIGGVCVEVKIAGPPDRALRQLARYATHDRVTALVLVTSLAAHKALPGEVGGKPLAVAYMGGVR